jgi:hypothetical protein
VESANVARPFTRSFDHGKARTDLNLSSATSSSPSSRSRQWTLKKSSSIFEATDGFVGLFKIGRANYLGEITKTTDWESCTHRMIDLCERRV